MAIAWSTTGCTNCNGTAAFAGNSEYVANSGQPETTGTGVNDFGEIVGHYHINNGTQNEHGFGSQQGPFDYPNAVATLPQGINNAGQVVGSYTLTANNPSAYHGFVFDAGQFTTIDFPGAVATWFYGINNKGQIVGYYLGSNNNYYGFVLTLPVTFVDPVPDLLASPETTTDTNLLATKGTPVDGVAADGVSQMVIRIPTAGAGHQFQVTLLNDQIPTPAPSNSPNEDGALGLPGATSFTQNQVTVNAGQLTSNGFAYAFAVYQAPADFARPNGAGGFKKGACSYPGTSGASTSDDQSGCRTVFLQIQDLSTTPPTTFPEVSITVVRPPVILIHGLWGDGSDWDNFYPLVHKGITNTLLFHNEQIDYSSRIKPTSTYPPLIPGTQLFPPKENSLGYEHNGAKILKEITKAIDNFKGGDNPVGASVAAVQADVVVHSMGGVFARTLPLTGGFFDNSFGQGLIHKLITLDATHLGSPLATMLLDLHNTCTRTELAAFGKYSFSTVTYANGQMENGAMLELQPNSAALNKIAQSGPHPLPAALVAGFYTNWTSLDCMNCFVADLKTDCKDALAQSFTSTSWPLNFGSTNNANDGIAAVTSQLNGPLNSTLQLPTGTVSLPFSGIAHSTGLFRLNFTPPSALDANNPIATATVNLLNTPVYQAPFTTAINP